MIISFRCYYPEYQFTNHFQELEMKDIPRWIDAYKFTHPDCRAISVKVYFNDGSDGE